MLLITHTEYTVPRKNNEKCMEKCTSCHFKACNPVGLEHPNLLLDHVSNISLLHMSSILKDLVLKKSYKGLKFPELEPAGTQ